MCHHICLFYTDGQTELKAALSANSISRTSTCVTCFRTQSGNVEELAVSPSVDVDSLAAVLEGVLEKPGEKGTEKCRCKDAALFHPDADWEGFGCRPIEIERAAHVFME